MRNRLTNVGPAFMDEPSDKCFTIIAAEHSFYRVYYIYYEDCFIKRITYMFTAQVNKVQILSLSGIMEDVYTAPKVIRKWNMENADRTGKLFLPVADSASASDADVVIGIVGNYIEKKR